MSFAIFFVNMNEHTCTLFKKRLDDVRPKGSWEINTVKHNYHRYCILILYRFQSYNRGTLYYHQRI